MFQMTEEARKELQKRNQSRPSKQLVRLQMRVHYFRNKKLDYLADKTGFKQFDMV
ncbi:hypothetical protein PP175_12590 [Aneurinibacillus sp. Ricciae_BoGa-3]|uniref:hypothetical protein n=1 Tax=Aneurinibacillus sp. Ricciae_BoGa-3 TaxID=3022697 RepID=UPI002340101C|nr:hypothetical protein [Aneurinibacillus sp. Ricciae_BoGa-3]WCK56676.1 hypothetical protein PP175_12590 [Aneurinibacillus sp. Ricciae_BoGa-3]